MSPLTLHAVRLEVSIHFALANFIRDCAHARNFQSTVRICMKIRNFYAKLACRICWAIANQFDFVCWLEGSRLIRMPSYLTKRVQSISVLINEKIRRLHLAARKI